MAARTWVVLIFVGMVAGTAGFVARGNLVNVPAESPPEVKVEAKVPNQIRFPDGAPQLAALRVEAAIEAPLPIAEPLNGRVTYDEDATARITSPIAGRITALRVSAGDSVKAGDVLAAVDAPDMAAAVADLRKAEADEARKKLSLERAQRLMDAEVIPRKDLEVAQADHVQAQAETQRARLRLRNLVPGGAGERGFALRSPVGGVVAERKANPSMEVQPGMAEPLFVVSNLKRLWVLVDLPERHLSRVAAGLDVAVTVDAYPGEIFRARVARVGQVVDPATRRVQVRCDITNEQGVLKPEMYARVSLLTRNSVQALRLPNSALVTEGLYSFVFVESERGTFIKRRVELAVQDREFSYLTSGVHKGERVVVGGALLLQSEMASGA